MPRHFCRLFSFPLLMLAGGCSVYLDGFRFVPRPAMAQIAATQPQEPPPVTVFASVVGVRRDDPAEHIPPSVEIRVRLQNNGPHSVRFDPQSMELLNGDLTRFAPPMLNGEPPVTLVPQQSAVVDADFPFPPGSSYYNTDLDSLELRLQAEIDGHPAYLTLNFYRRSIRYYEPDYDYPPYVGYGWYGPGVVIVHRR